MHLAAQLQAPLLPKLRGYLAEFPCQRPPDTPKLSKLAPPVLVLGTNSRNRINRFFMGSWAQRNPLARAIPDFNLLLLVTSLCRPATVKQGLPCSIYPEASAIEVVSPRLSARHRNLKRFPFCPRVISWRLRIGLLLADERCQETRVLSAPGILIRIKLLLTPGYAFLRGPLDFST